MTPLRMSLGNAWLRRNGVEVHLPGLPDGAAVIEWSWDAPEHALYITPEDVRSLRLLLAAEDEGRHHGELHRWYFIIGVELLVIVVELALILQGVLRLLRG